MAIIQTIFNFHSIGPLSRTPDVGEMDYNVSEETFRDWLALIASNRDRVGITFDDGNKSDLEIAAPFLLEKGLHASFFVLAGKIGAPGYLDEQDILDLQRSGMTIGSHGLDHVGWTKCGPDQLQNELATSKRILEEIIGRPVLKAAAPFGMISPSVYKQVRQAGYERLYTSSARSAFSASHLVPRYSVKAEHKPREMMPSLIRPARSWPSSLKSAAQHVRYSLASS